MSDLTQDQPTPESIQQLRDAADRSKANATEAEQAKRELALVKAGVDTESPLGKMFHRSYDGELTKEAIQAAWLEVNPGGTPPEPTTTTTSTPEQTAETQTRRTLSSGGAGDTPGQEPQEDPVQRGYSEFRERMANGESREKAAGSVFGSLMAAAAAGDERAIVKPWTPEQLGQ